MSRLILPIMWNQQNKHTVFYRDLVLIGINKHTSSAYGLSHPWKKVLGNMAKMNWIKD